MGIGEAAIVRCFARWKGSGWFWREGRDGRGKTPLSIESLETMVYDTLKTGQRKKISRPKFEMFGQILKIPSKLGTG
jgi:hypothetical protein